VVAQRDGEAYDELYVYAMGRDPASFILQHVVDAHAAQTATPVSRAITLVFALVGLYLHVERGWSGKQVQQIHMRMGRQKREWPPVALPHDRSVMTAAGVLAKPAGAERDSAIDAWCRSVWESFHQSRETIIELLRKHDVV